MKTLFVKDLKDGMSLFGEDFAVKTFQKITKNNTTYIDITLADNTGELKAKAWSDSLPKIATVSEGTVAAITAKVQEHPKFGTQLIVTELAAVSDFNANDFIASSRYDIEEMWSDVTSFRSKIMNKHLKEILNSIFTEDIADKFKTSAAALSVHHGYRGGLSEHTLEMLRLSSSLVSEYPRVNFDLLTTGIILHDFGKIFEYKTDLTVTMTPEGKLLGHIFIGSNYIKEHAPKDMPQDLLDELIHIILSHHGELEFGSPVKPRTIEAIIVSRLDDTSAKINSAYNVVQGLSSDTKFSPYHKQLGTELYNSPYYDTLVNEDIPF